MSGDTRYPGWCCRQIAAQLSQALFTMADLHAQVSDLREENRQLKIKIGCIGIRRVQEEKSPPKSPDKVTISEKTFPPTEKVERSNHFSPVAQFKQEHEPDPGSQDPSLENASISKELKSENVVSNISITPIIDGRNGNSADASTSFMGRDFKCDKCECSFPSSDLLTIHQAVHIGRSFHVCKVCNAMFLLKADLNRHWTTHPNIKQHICQLCGKAYTSKNNYKLHIKTHTGVGLYPCEVCGKAFHSENHLNVHRRIHTGERPYECQYCDKSFTQKSGLINHTRLHTGEKPFLCPSCPKAFTQKSNLNFHLSKHHPVSGEAVLVSFSKQKSISGEAPLTNYEHTLKNIQSSPQLLPVPVEVTVSKHLPGSRDRPLQGHHPISANLLP